MFAINHLEYFTYRLAPTSAWVKRIPETITNC